MSGSIDFLKRKPVLLMVGGEKTQARSIIPVAVALAERRRLIAEPSELPFVQRILHWSGKMATDHFLGNPGTRPLLKEIGASLQLDVSIDERRVINLRPPEEAVRRLGGMLLPENDAVIIVLAGEVEVYLRPELIQALKGPEKQSGKHPDKQPVKQPQ